MTKRTTYRRVLSPEAEALFARVFEVTGCKTQVELSELLGITQSSISNAQRRESIPAEWLIKMLINHNINPAWILSDKLPKKLNLDRKNSHRIQEIIPPIEEKVAENKTSSLEDLSTEDLIVEAVRRILLRT